MGAPFPDFLEKNFTDFLAGRCFLPYSTDAYVHLWVILIIIYFFAVFFGKPEKILVKFLYSSYNNYNYWGEFQPAPLP